MNPAWIAFAIATAVSTFIGYCLTASLLPATLPRRWVWAFAPGAGLSLCSFLFFLFRRPIFTVEFALVIAFAFLMLRRRPSFGKISLSWRPPALSLAVMGALGLALAGSMVEVHRLPHGGSDGWAIWNTHARLLYRDGPAWQNKIEYTFHGDYPELTPSITARFWRYAGAEVPEAGALIGILLALSTVAVLGITLSELRNSTVGLLLPLIMFATPSYLDHASCQYADIPLAFFILSTIALICLHSARSSSERGLLVLAGFMAGCAGWTKNEGLLFILATCIVLLVPALWNRSIMAKRFVPFLAGLVLPLAVIIFFKAAIAPPNDLIGSQRYLDVIGRISDVNRYVTILKTFGVNFWVFGRWSVCPLLPLFAFIGLRGIDRQMLRTYGWVSGIAVLAIVLVGYYLVYLNTPFELYTHLYSSLDRLMLHLWPSCLLLLGLCTKTRTTAGDSDLLIYSRGL